MHTTGGGKRKKKSKFEFFLPDLFSVSSSVDLDGHKIFGGKKRNTGDARPLSPPKDNQTKDTAHTCHPVDTGSRWCHRVIAMSNNSVTTPRQIQQQAVDEMITTMW